MGIESALRARPRLWRAAGLALFVLGVTGLVALFVSWNASKAVPQVPLKYGVVLDAGSSHTKVTLYQWPADKENGTGVVSQTTDCSVEGPGISSYAHAPAGAGRSLGPCLRALAARVPAERRAESPAFLGATAGMRLLELQDPVATEQILASVRDALRRSEFSFREARILTGEEEGACGWVTVNYLKGNFLQSPDASWVASAMRWWRPEPLVTHGALDLGGASTQISFVPRDPPRRDASSFRLFGSDYAVYTHSFLCYGRDQASLALLRTVIEAARGNDTVLNPCYNAGYSRSVRLADVYGGSCTRAPYPGGGTWVPAANTTVTLVGTGDAAQCLQAVRRIFNFSACDNNPECSFNGVYQPPVEGGFMAFAGFYFTMQSLNLTHGDGTASVATFNSKLATACSRTWAQAQQANPGVREDRLRAVCFNGHYVQSLLLDGYGFTEESFAQIRFLKSIQGSSLGWTLGYMLNQTNMVPAVRPPRGSFLPVGALSTLLLLFCLLLLASLAICFVLVRRGSSSKRRAEAGGAEAATMSSTVVS
ncbi:ectonucleoside triphosphate diphosphohydrolase 8-like [Petromyzon marinus]|uniref:Ectonucleoside triphosphate diphosphohydrolase 8-like n=1 Tax=Petromyzon marinus TaxID=7757 RepID=A0AAJ7WS77_PETMA|nr:ectonucleoside triphosphate diphosphohydrolase 8-like [Petromyzon marinus]XP_032806768.1 ectonucleoside triphosphate diphosphohydrolase 8-like [Petromyzon marinus]